MASGTLTLSRAELSALLLRAGRGAGVPLGHAEDMAAAVGGHGSSDAVGDTGRALERGWSAPDMAEAGAGLTFPKARAIACLPTALDALRAGVESVVLEDLDAPSLVSPYLRSAAASHGVAFEARRSGKDWRLLPAASARNVPVAPRVRLEPAQLAALNRLAARTYVPSSEASRAGAGAGAIDND